MYTSRVESDSATEDYMDIVASHAAAEGAPMQAPGAYNFSVG